MKYKPAIVRAYFLECGLPEPELEFKFCETRKWRWDVAWADYYCTWSSPREPALRFVAIEVQGGSFSRKLGAHSRGGHLRKQYEKHNEAMAMGWRVLQVFPEDLCTMDTVRLVRRCLGISVDPDWKGSGANEINKHVQTIHDAGGSA